MKSGFILVNKPMGFTSFDVIAKLRGILKTKKLGHGGTLDPNATGVLPVFVEGATKAIDLLNRQDKKYIARIKLGIETDTQDIWGEVLSTCEPICDEEKIKEAIESFKGEISQLPPMYSAIKINGVRLYDLARQGIEISRDERIVNIYSIKYLGKTENENEYEFSVHCSKGTYIRTLCVDIGEKLGCSAAMSSLCRTMALGFSIDDAVSLEKIEELSKEGRVEEIISDTQKLFSEFPPIVLNEKLSHLYKNGVGLHPQRVSGVLYDEVYKIGEGQRYAVYDSNRNFIGIGHVDYQKKEFRSLKMFLKEQA